MENLSSGRAGLVKAYEQSTRSFAKALVAWAQAGQSPEEALCRILGTKQNFDELFFRSLKLGTELERLNSPKLQHDLLNALESLKLANLSKFCVSEGSLRSYNFARLKSVSKPFLSALFKIFGLDLRSEVLAKVDLYWASNKQHRAIDLVAKFELHEEAAKSIGATEWLLERNDIQGLTRLLPPKKVVETLMAHRNKKAALKVIKSSKLNLGDFPSLVAYNQTQEVFGTCVSNNRKLFLLQAIERLDPQQLPTLVTALANKGAWRRERAAQLLHQNPRLVVPEAHELLKYPKRALKGLPTDFGPLHSEIELCLPLSEVIFIADVHQLSLVKRRGDVLAIDCEDIPNQQSKYNTVSLVQLAFRDVVYVIDWFKLKNEAKAPLLALLEDSSLVKLGFNLIHDFRQLGLPTPTNLFDLSTLLSKEGTPGGLATLCGIVLGKPLCKVEQCSNWANRPLRASQLHYAALDAHILITLWEAVTEPVTIPKVLCKHCFLPHEEKHCQFGPRCRVCGRFFHSAEECEF